MMNNLLHEDLARTQLASRLGDAKRLRRGHFLVHVPKRRRSPRSAPASAPGGGLPVGGFAGGASGP